MKAQKASKEQQLDMMSRHYKQLESRLDDVLSRIANETEEIRDLEQQLTDGQIAANEALKKDLEEVILGLQEYLKNVKNQTKQANDECKTLREEKEALLRRLEEVEEERNQLEIVAIDAENLRKETANLEQALQQQRELNEALQEAQGEISAYEAELEAELKARDTEASRQKEELRKLKQVEQSQLGKERQALENALARARLCEEREQENQQLVSQLRLLQVEYFFPMASVALLHFLQRINVSPMNVERKLVVYLCHNSKDILGKSLAELQKQFAEIFARSQQENESCQARERLLQKEMATQRAELEEAQEKYKLACNRAAEAKRRQNEARVQQLEGEIQHLVEKLKSMEEIQGLTDQQLQEADEEKDQILAELEDLENTKKAEDARAQLQFHSLSKELKALKEAISASDKQAAAQLCAAKDQLQSLHGTVCRINRERSEELQEAEKFCMQATQAAKDLARAEAEIGLLQKLLGEKEAQVCSVCKRPLSTMEPWRQTLRVHGYLFASHFFPAAEIIAFTPLFFCLKYSHYIGALPSGEYFSQLKLVIYCCLSSFSKASTPASQSTKDSGVILQCPVSTPVIKPNRKLSESRKAPDPASGECCVHGSGPAGLQEPSSGKGHQSDGETLPGAAPCLLPPGSIIYTLLPDGNPVPQGTVLYGPVTPTSVVYGSPPTGVQGGTVGFHPLLLVLPSGALENTPGLHPLQENDILRLEDSLETLRSRRQKDESCRTSRAPNKEMEELSQGIQGLLKEKEELESQVAELQRVAQKRSQRHIDLIEGRGDDLTAELELENSIQCHESIMDEIECVEKTLLKRRAELREADCLLAEAETELENTRGKTKETIQKYNTAKQHLSRTEKEAEELERRTQEMAVRLVKADQELRFLQANAQDLQQHKMEQEGILKEINQIVSAKDSEFQVLSQKIEILTERYFLDWCI
uniref:Centriolin n=1 Tax=Pseudonaja textilis TaxID=8673 RepID=A0A670YBU1_PSETE